MSLRPVLTLSWSQGQEGVEGLKVAQSTGNALCLPYKIGTHLRLSGLVGGV